MNCQLALLDTTDIFLKQPYGFGNSPLLYLLSEGKSGITKEHLILLPKNGWAVLLHCALLKALASSAGTMCRAEANQS